jgi:hypothetical protein
VRNTQNTKLSLVIEIRAFPSALSRDAAVPLREQLFRRTAAPKTVGATSFSSRRVFQSQRNKRTHRNGRRLRRLCGDANFDSFVMGSAPAAPKSSQHASESRSLASKEIMMSRLSERFFSVRCSCRGDEGRYLFVTIWLRYRLDSHSYS